MCRGARRAKTKARSRALTDLLEAMAEADRALRAELEDSQRDVAWIGGALCIQAVMPDGQTTAAMMCPTREQTKHFAISIASNRGEVDAVRNVSSSLQPPRYSPYALPNFDGLREPEAPSAPRDANESSRDPNFDSHFALRQLQRRPRDLRRLRNALARLNAKGPYGLALDEIRMATLALRRAREYRELAARLRIRNFSSNETSSGSSSGVGDAGEGPGRGETGRTQGDRVGGDCVREIHDAFINELGR